LLEISECGEADHAARHQQQLRDGGGSYEDFYETGRYAAHVPAMQLFAKLTALLRSDKGSGQFIDELPALPEHVIRMYLLEIIRRLRSCRATNERPSEREDNSHDVGGRPGSMWNPMFTVPDMQR